jgi:hypothetical protein
MNSREKLRAVISPDALNASAANLAAKREARKAKLGRRGWASPNYPAAAKRACWSAGNAAMRKKLGDASPRFRVGDGKSVEAGRRGGKAKAQNDRARKAAL